MRYGEQEPTIKIDLSEGCNYEEALDAISTYESTGRKAQEWQINLVKSILAMNDDGLWVHSKVGYSVPRRNGKGEILTIIELYAIKHGLNALHTAHKTTTSSAASVRLSKLMDSKGYHEISRMNKDKTYVDEYTYSKQFGLEKITLLGEGGGSVAFRTRTTTGGLGEGYDILIIDEAQEYTDEQQSTLQYIVSDSANPMIIMCGTPPTFVSKGTVFNKYRKACIDGHAKDSFWAEWSVEEKSDVNDVELWYKCNPAMGYQLNERKIDAEDKSDELDFNIQRLGLWVKYELKSAITKQEWTNLYITNKPVFVGNMAIGIKYGKDGNNVAMAVAVATSDGHTFVEVVDCVSRRKGNDWILSFLAKAQSVGCVIVDGINGQSLLEKDVKDANIKQKLTFPTTKEYIEANAMFEKNIFDKVLQHSNQPSLMQVATNCEKRLIGTAGGFGYKSIKENCDIALLDSVILAQWGLATQMKEPKKQKVNY